MLPLLSYIDQQFPFWRLLNRRERMHALHGILPMVEIGVDVTRTSFADLPDSPPLILRDVHVSLDSHYTRIRTPRGLNTVFNHAAFRLGYEPDLELPLVRSAGGSIHCLESLVVII